MEFYGKILACSKQTVTQAKKSLTEWIEIGVDICAVPGSSTNYYEPAD